MELLDGIKSRKSCRAFKSLPVPREVIEKILEAASRSPSYTNTQPWEIAVVSGEKKNKLSEILYEMAKSAITPNPDLESPKSWPQELEKRSKEHGARRFKVLGIERDDVQKREELRLLNFKFYGAPCVLFLYIDSGLTSWSIFDLGLFAQSLILAAHSLGLGTCIQASITNYPDTIREFLEIPKTKRLVLGISLGYPDSQAIINTYQSNRVSPGDFTQWYD